MKDKTLPKLRQDWFLAKLEGMKLEKPNAILEAKMDTSKGLISNIINKKRFPTEDFLKTFCESFEINWEDAQKEIELLKQQIVEDAPVSYARKVPLFDTEAIAGSGYAANLAPVVAPSTYIELGDMLRNDSQAAMYVFGSSMTPNYPSGCIIGLRQNLDGIIQPGEVYVIETDSNRYFKRLYYNDDQTAYVCLSDNTMVFEAGPRKGKHFYEPFDIRFDQVRRLFDVTGVIKRNQNSSIQLKAV